MSLAYSSFSVCLPSGLLLVPLIHIWLITITFDCHLLAGTPLALGRDEPLCLLASQGLCGPN